MNYLIDTVGLFEQGRITLRTQADPDRKKLLAVCPKDQTKHFRGTWIDGNFVLTEVDVTEATPSLSAADEAIAAEAKRLAELTPGELETLGAELGVEWDANASPETMCQRIAMKKLIAEDPQNPDRMPAAGAEKPSKKPAKKGK